MVDISNHRSPLVTHPSHDEESFVLYQPQPMKQILLYDMATSSSVLSFLKMKGIPTSIRKVTNTEFMSDNGRVPVVVDRNHDEPMCGFTEVFWHVSRMSNYTPTLLELAYMDWVQSKFLEAELYICWCHEQILTTYTKTRYTYDLPWPVSTVLFKRKRTQMQNDLGNKYKTYDEFLRSFNQFLSLLNKRIGNRPYCLSESSPSCVDALIYGHTKAILSSSLDPRLVDAINKQRRITNLTDLIEGSYPS